MNWRTAANNKLHKALEVAHGKGDDLPKTFELSTEDFLASHAQIQAAHDRMRQIDPAYHGSVCVANPSAVYIDTAATAADAVGGAAAAAAAAGRIWVRAVAAAVASAGTGVGGDGGCTAKLAASGWCLVATTIELVPKQEVSVERR